MLRLPARRAGDADTAPYVQAAVAWVALESCLIVGSPPDGLLVMSYMPASHSEMLGANLLPETVLGPSVDKEAEQQRRLEHRVDQSV